MWKGWRIRMNGRNRVKKGILAFGIPVLILLAVYAVWGQYPFGNKTLLIWDMNWQYSAFFSALHDILHGDASAWYSFSRAIGGDMAGVAAYYLMSPFNLIFYFFDETTIYIGILLVVLLKVGSIGVAMNFYLRSHHEENTTLIFSTAYALCAYVIGYFFNIMWMDGLICLPLIAWGIEKIVEQRKYLLYTLALAGGIITNFYIGFMLCFFSVLYVIVYAVFLSEKRAERERGRWWKTVFCYGASSLAGGMLSAFIALPTLFSMQGSKERIDIPSLWNFVWQIDIRWLFAENFAGTIQGRQMILGNPLMYCGVITFLLVVFYFLCTPGEWRRKCGYFLLIGFVGISFGYANLSKIWQAFNYANGSPYRFSFVYCFLLVLVAYETFYRYGDRVRMERKQAVGWILISLLLGVGIVICRNFFMGSMVKETPWMNLLLIIVYGGILLAIGNRRLRNGLLFAVLCVELFLNAEFLYQNGEHYETVAVDEYRNYMEQMKPLVEKAKEDEAFCRTVFDKAAAWSVNDGFLFGIAGLDSYTSVERESTHEIAKRLGFPADESFGIHYESGSTLFAESVLGVKYKISPETPQAGYDLREENKGLALYENRYAFPFAWFADETILEAEEVRDDFFAYQNKICAAADAKTEAVLKPLTGEIVSAQECEQQADGGYRMIEDGYLGYMIYQVYPPKETVLYLNTEGWGNVDVGVWRNGEEVDLSGQEGAIKRIGAVTPEDDISIRSVVVEDCVFYCNENGIYMEDEAQLAKCADTVQKQGVSIRKKSDARIDIACENEDTKDRYLICTMPYDEGWKITVDDGPSEVVQVLGNLTAIRLAPGEHKIQLRFVPKGLYAGCVITTITVLLIFMQSAILQKGKLRLPGGRG